MKKEVKVDNDFSSIDWNANNYFINNNKDFSKKTSNDYNDNDINKSSNNVNNNINNPKKTKKNKRKKNKKKKNININNNNNNNNNNNFQNINNNNNNINNNFNSEIYYFKDPQNINNNTLLKGNMLNYNSNIKFPFTNNNNISLQNSFFVNNQNNINNLNPLNNSFNFNINNNISYTYININNPNSNNINNNYIIPYNNNNSNKNSMILSQLNFMNKNFNFYNKTKSLDSPRNKIHFENILRQKDKRTTIIIRHIPNKYSIKLLTDELNVNYKDKYDLIYLPIDSINLCNLGFGFINFTFNMHIISFYDEYYGKKWLKFNSEKHCELAYAKIQGKESLLKHVKQNSNYNNDKGVPIYYLKNNVQPTLVKLPSKYLAAFLNFYPYAKYKNENGYFIVESF